MGRSSRCALAGILGISTIGIFAASQAGAETFPYADIVPISDGAAEVKGDHHTEFPDIETDYLPRVLQSQKDSAGFNVNPEALDALAVADRSFLYYSLESKNYIGLGKDSLPYDASLQPQTSIDAAVSDTQSQVIQLGMDAPIIGYSADGARPTGGTPFGVANLADADPTGTEKYVTYNQGRHGTKVLTTKLGSKLDPYNRGALSIQGADFLADHGWNYLDILQFYFGSDAQLGALDLTALNDNGLQLTIDNFENNPGMLQSAGQKNASDQFVLFNGNTDAMRSTKTANSGRASELLNIDYDSAHAKGTPFTFNMMSGEAGNEGKSLGNLMLPYSTTQVGFYLCTKTAGMSAQMKLNIADGTEQSVGKKIIADGKWHKYTWDIQTNADWNPIVGGNGKYDSGFTINSISLHGTSDASVRIDDVFYKEPPFVDNEGGGITAGGTFSLGGAGIQLNSGSAIGTANLNGITTIGNLNLGAITATGSLNFGTGSVTIIKSNEFPIGDISDISQLAPNTQIINVNGFVTETAGIPGTVLVPEPVSIAIIAVGTFALSRRRTRRHSLALSR